MALILLVTMSFIANYDVMELERYVINIEYFGTFDMESDNIFYAIESLKNELSPDIQFNILSAFVIKKDDFLIEITEYLISK